MRALVENLVDVVHRVLALDLESLDPLVLVVIVDKLFLDLLLDFLGRHLLGVFFGDDLLKRTPKRDFPDRLHRPLRRVDEMTVVEHHHTGNLAHLDKFSKGRINPFVDASEGVAGFRIDKEDAFVFHHPHDALDKGEVSGKFSFWEATDVPHQPFPAVEPLDGADPVRTVREGGFDRGLEIGEAGVGGDDDVRTF